MENRMYRENVKSLNPFVGCLHNCVYCKPSFQRFAKMSKCKDCQEFKPHFHPERLNKDPPATTGNQFIFYPSMGDPVFAQVKWLQKMISYADTHHLTKFLFQSKNPRKTFYKRIWPGECPSNVILATTIETDLDSFNTPSIYSKYKQISEAPLPRLRTDRGLSVITIEPILDFTIDGMMGLIKECHPTLSIIYVGYDNHHCKLPEPPIEKTLNLIKSLKSAGYEVREKSIRPAWYESSVSTQKGEVAQ